MAREVYPLHIFKCIAWNHSKETLLPFDKDDNDDNKNEISLWKSLVALINRYVFNKIFID